MSMNVNPAHVKMEEAVWMVSIVIHVTVLLDGLEPTVKPVSDP